MTPQSDDQLPSRQHDAEPPTRYTPDPVSEAARSAGNDRTDNVAPLSTVTPAQWRAGVTLAAVGLGAAFAAALLTVMLILVGVYSIGLDSAELGPIASGWFFAVVQLVGMGFLSPLGGSVSSDGLLSTMEASTTAFLVPAIVPATTVVAIMWLGRRSIHGLTMPRGVGRMLVAVAGGVTFATVVAALTGLLPLRIGDELEASLALRAVSIWGFLVSAGVVATASYMVLGERGEHAVPAAWRQASRQVGEHLGGLGAFLGLAVIIGIMATLDEGAAAVALALPVLLPLLAANSVTLASLSTVTISGSGSTLLGGGLADTSATLFTDDALPGWLQAGVVALAAAATVVAALRWRARRGPVTSTGLDWALLPTSYGAVGLLVLAIGTVGATYTGGDLLGASGTIGPAPWTFLVLAILGLVVDILARTVALPLLRALPAGLASALIGRVGDRRRGEPTRSAPTDRAETQAQAQAEQAGPDADQPADIPVATGRPLSAKARRGWIAAGVGVVVAAVLAVGGSVLHDRLATTTYGPQPKVEAYLESLIDGRATDAVALLDPNVTSSERLLLSDEVYAAAENRPTDYEIVEASIDEDGAQVDATLTMDTKTYPVSFVLSRHGTQAWVFDDWRISEGPAQHVTLGHVADSPQVNDVEVDLAPFSVSADYVGDDLPVLPILPGTYTFAAPAGTTYRTYGDDQTVTVVPGATYAEDTASAGSAFVHFEQAWTPAASEEAIGQVTERIASCMSSDQFKPEGCASVLEMYDPGFMAVTNIERTWAAPPEITFDDGSESGDASAEPAVVITGGDITIAYESRWDEDDTWEDDSSADYSVFGGWSATRVPVSVGSDGELELDFSEF